MFWSRPDRHDDRRIREKGQNKALWLRGPPRHPHTANFPTDVCGGKSDVQTYWGLIAHRHIYIYILLMPIDAY